jgi:hypothetical protein
LSGKLNGGGDEGVGGGALGRVADVDVEMGERLFFVELRDRVSVSVSVSEPERVSSQVSATGLDLGLAWVFKGVVVESLIWERDLTSSSLLCKGLVFKRGDGWGRGLTGF